MPKRMNETAIPTLASDEVEQALARLEGLARLMDSAIRIPGTDLRIGLDAAIGVVPVLGDLVTHAVSAYLIYEARRLGASRWLIARMAANTTIDTIIGAVPVLGDAFDLMYRANQKNMRLLRAHLEKNGINLAAHVGRPHGTRGPVIDQDGNILQRS